MAQVLVNFRIDENVKHNLENICDDLGMNLSTAFNMFARKMVKEKKLPFELSLDTSYTYDKNVRDKALCAFNEIRKLSAKRKEDMSLEEINNFINEVRHEKKAYAY